MKTKFKKLLEDVFPKNIINRDLTNENPKIDPRKFYTEFMEAGRSHGIMPPEPDQKYLEQLQKGIQVEFEHTTNMEISRKIAMDHLAEIPDYYDRLEKWKMKQGNKNESKEIV